MKIYLKYFFLVILFDSCKQNTDQAIEKNYSLYPEPISVTLNTSNGYTINQLTSDSIKPLINSLGDTVQTGIPLALKATIADAEKITKPSITKVVIQSEELIASNIHHVPEKLEIISGDTIDIQNSNEKISTGTPINITGQIKSLHEPQPVKILQLRFKDGATSNIQYLDVGQGLSYSFVHCMLADRNGYLWFGLDGNGLCKYDGISITNYTEKEGLLNNNVQSLVEDSAGNIWIATDKGFCVFDGKNITQYTKNTGFLGGPISKIFKDKKENIWIIGSEIPVIRYDGKKFTQYANWATMPQEILNPFFEDSHGSVWYKTKSGLGKFDGTKFINYPVRKNKADTSSYIMFEDRKGNLWVGSTFEGICKYDGKNFKRYTDKEGLSGNNIVSLIEDKIGNMWFGIRYNGINKFDGTNFITYSIKDGLTSNAITGLVVDNNGNIWSGSEGGGVNKLDDGGFEEIVKMENLGNSRVRPIMKDAEKNLWFGTEAGRIFKFDGKFITNYINPDVSPGRSLRSMLADKKGNLWFGYTDNIGLYKYDQKHFLHFTAASGIRGDNIMSILEDKNENIWLGTYGGGINIFNGKTFSYYSEEEKFSGKNVYTILEDKQGNLWFGTLGGGIVKYDGNTFTTFSEREGFYGKGVTTIVEDEEGNLWFGTLGAGLCKFDGSRFTYFTEKQGLSYNDVWSLKEDDKGQFWVGTDKGLSLLIPRNDSVNQIQKKYSIYSFGLQAGLKGTDFNLHSVCIDNNKRIWWGTGKALITRDLNNVFFTSIPSSLGLKHIDINGKFYDFRNMTDSDSKKISFSNVSPFNNYPSNLVLTYDQNHLIFHFSAIDWSAPNKIKYSYRLTGLENTWSNPTEETQVDYRNLGHGSYQFQVKAIGQSQVWTEAFNYSFVIRPAWWQTWWFKTFVMLLVVLTTLLISRFIYLFRLRKQKAQLEKQLAVEYERQRISTEMHDDIGAGLSGVRLLTELTKNKFKDTDAINDMDNIYQSVGDISAKMKEVIWSLNTENDNLGNLVLFIQKQVRSQLEHYLGEISFDIPATFPDIQISGEERRNIYLAVKEAVHNIIKHSGADKIKLSVNTNEKLKITISDNGKGMDIEKNKSTGNGMKNMRMRMQKLNGELSVKNEEGLTLIFKIPFKTGI